ncbi:uncharacterized protein LOC122195017 isoform X1 [Lactuca sativa]|uniref:uncharacterized protein LOC122195017 isoform X1 n=1 Tax=Lactuca sativa TaxID=4236 RepID=UPI001C68E359|nr:uncharacterized protein LOC122195017 isoform X1 [Lactuca sativa]
MRAAAATSRDPRRSLFDRNIREREARAKEVPSLWPVVQGKRRQKNGRLRGCLRSVVCLAVEVDGKKGRYSVLGLLDNHREKMKQKKNVLFFLFAVYTKSRTRVILCSWLESMQKEKNMEVFGFVVFTGNETRTEEDLECLSGFRYPYQSL